MDGIVKTVSLSEIWLFYLIILPKIEIHLVDQSGLYGCKWASGVPLLWISTGSVVSFYQITKKEIKSERIE